MTLTDSCVLVDVVHDSNRQLCVGHVELHITNTSCVLVM